MSPEANEAAAQEMFDATVDAFKYLRSVVNGKVHPDPERVNAASRILEAAQLVALN